MKTSESIIKIAPALLDAQKRIGAAKKGSKNPFFHSTYASLGDVMEACKDILNEYDITVLQPVCGEFVETVLLHSSGEWISSSTPITPKLTITTKETGEVIETKSDPQATGSAISYARRYGLQSMVFIPAEDDDAEKAINHTSKETKTVYATDKQVGMIAKLLTQKGQSDEDLKLKYKVQSKKDLTVVQASQIIENLLKLPDVDQIKEVDISER